MKFKAGAILWSFVTTGVLAALLIPTAETTEDSSSDCLKLTTSIPNIAGQSGQNGDPVQICQSELYTFHCEVNNTNIFWSYSNHREVFHVDDKPIQRVLNRHIEDHSVSFVLHSTENLTINQTEIHRMRSSLTVYPPMDNKSFQFSVECSTACGQHVSMYRLTEKLEAPKNLRLEPRRYPNCNTTSYRFTWQQADGLDVNIFDYYEWTFNDYNSAKTSGRASYIYDVSELNPSSRYHFEVCAVDKCGQKGGCARIQNKEEVSCRREMNGDT